MTVLLSCLFFVSPPLLNLRIPKNFILKMQENILGINKHKMKIPISYKKC